MLYLNQTVRVQPTMMKPYVEQFVSALTPLMRRHGIELVGLWQALGANEFVDLWEVREWADLDRLGEAIRQDQNFVAYLDQANTQRIKSSVKLLHPTPFCPDLARIKREQIKGGLYMLATIPIVPDRLQEYLKLFPQNGMRLEEKHGLHTLGYWIGGGADQTEAFNCTQICVIEDWAHWGRFVEARGKDPEVAEWMRRALFYRTFHSARWMTPAYIPY
jgi:NIPSNAP